MTDNTDDYSPIGEQGTLEVQRRGMLRRAQWTSVPSSPGSVILIQTESGDYKAINADSTASERLFVKPTKWVAVDVAPHTLDYKIAFTDPTGSRGFIAHVSVQVRVIHAPAAVKDGARTVKGHLLAALTTAVAKVGERVTPAATEGRPVLTGTALAEAQAEMRSIVGQEVARLPDWLQAQITSAEVELDEATAEHLTNIVAVQNTGELFAIQTAGQRYQDEQEHLDELARMERRRALDEQEHERQLTLVRRTAALAALEREFGATALAAEHEAELLQLRHAGARALLVSANRLADAEQQKKLGELWRAALGPALATPSGRRMETFFLDPTPENLQRVVHELEATDRRGWHDILVLLQQAVDKELVDVDDPIHQTLMELFSRLPGYPALLSNPPATNGIAASDDSATIDGQAVADGEGEDAEPSADGEPADAN